MRQGGHAQRHQATDGEHGPQRKYPQHDGQDSRNEQRADLAKGHEDGGHGRALVVMDGAQERHVAGAVDHGGGEGGQAHQRHAQQRDSGRGCHCGRQARNAGEAIADGQQVANADCLTNPAPHAHQQHRRQAERDEGPADLGAKAGVRHVDRRVDEVHHPPAVTAERQHPGEHQARLGGKALHEAQRSAAQRWPSGERQQRARRQGVPEPLAAQRRVVSPQPAGQLWFAQPRWKRTHEQLRGREGERQALPGDRVDITGGVTDQRDTWRGARTHAAGERSGAARFRFDGHVADAVAKRGKSLQQRFERGPLR